MNAWVFDGNTAGLSLTYNQLEAIYKRNRNANQSQSKT